MKKILAAFCALTLVLGMCAVSAAAAPAESGTPAPAYHIEYTTHIQSFGWQTYVRDGQRAGTSGKSLRLEALRVRLVGEDGTPVDPELLGVEYATHVQNIGWQAAVGNDDIAGTSGKSLRLEALYIRLTGTLADQYEVYYRVHCENFGDLGWAKDGQYAGSAGLSLRLEAIEINLFKKGESPFKAGGAYKTEENKGDITYQAYIGGRGWQTSAADGGMAGTQGKSCSMEALRIWLGDLFDADGDLIDGAVEYRAHIQNIGWSAWKQEGRSVGKSGLRMEAVEIRLTGDVAGQYDIYYRLHCRNIGTLGWAKNGQRAGTAGYSCRTESIEIRLVKKGGDAPHGGTICYLDADSRHDVSTSVYVKGAGFCPAVKNGETAGTTGQSKAITAMCVSLDTELSGSIRYAVNQGGAWSSYAYDGQTAGNTGGAMIEAIKIELTGELAKAYRVYYRTHVENYGWLGWAQDGQIAGTGNIHYRMEAVQVMLCAKVQGAPGSTSEYFRNYRAGGRVALAYAVDANMYNQIKNVPSDTPWLIAVDTNTNHVGAFVWTDEGWGIFQYYQCSSGAPDSPSLKGWYTIGEKGYSFSGDGHTCYWYSQISGNYLFHSILYQTGTGYPGAVMDGRLGMNISAGCVRLAIENAKWIYDYIPYGSRIVSW